MKINYLKFNEYNGYDDFYIKLHTDDTWKVTLEHIESVLDNKFCDNNYKLEGIKVSFEIVSLSLDEYRDLNIDENYLIKE